MSSSMQVSKFELNQGAFVQIVKFPFVIILAFSSIHKFFKIFKLQNNDEEVRDEIEKNLPAFDVALATSTNLVAVTFSSFTSLLPNP